MNFRLITAKFFGVQKLRNFTVSKVDIMVNLFQGNAVLVQLELCAKTAGKFER